MLRLVVLAPLVGGCHLAWELERETSRVCGPFAEPAPVPLNAELVEPRDFSVESSGTRGMIYAMYPRAVRPTGVHAIKLEAGEWRADPLRDNGAITSLDGGHIAEADAAVGWLVKEGMDLPEVREYQFSTVNNQWGQAGSGIVDPLQGQTSTAGNLIVLPGGAGTTIRFLVTVLMSDTASNPNTMRIFQLAPGDPAWRLTPQADPLKTSREKVNPSTGVMTADHGKLVYAATVGTRTVSRLYASERENDEFVPGREVGIDGVASDAELTEPWIDATCDTLYFRRDGTTWMARAVDATGSAP